MKIWNSLLSYIKWPLRIFSALIASCFVIIFIGLLWISSDSGEKYVKEIIVTELSAATGYEANVKDVQFGFPLKAHISLLSFADSKGIWFEIKGLTIDISFNQMIFKNLTISKFGISEGRLLRLPEAPSLQTEDGLTNVSASKDSGSGLDVTISAIDLGRLTIASDIVGGDADMVIGIGGSLSWKSGVEDLGIQSTIHIIDGISQLNQSHVTVKVNYNLLENLVKLHKLSLYDGEEVKSEHNSANLLLVGEGELNVKTEEVQFSFNTDEIALSRFNIFDIGSVTLGGEVLGSLSMPRALLHMETSGFTYQNNVVPDGVLTITAHKNKVIKANADTKYNREKDLISSENIASEGSNWEGLLQLRPKEEDGKVEANWSWDGDVLALSNILANYREARLQGEVSLVAESAQAIGAITLSVPELNNFQSYVPAKIQGKADVSLELDVDSDKQSMATEVVLNNVITDYGQLSSLKMNVGVEDIWRDIRPDRFSLDVDTMSAQGFNLHQGSVALVRSNVDENIGFSEGKDKTRGESIKTAAIWAGEVLAEGDMPISKKQVPFQLNTLGKVSVNSAEDWSVLLSSIKGEWSSLPIASKNHLVVTVKERIWQLATNQLMLGSGYYNVNARLAGDKMQGDVKGAEIQLSELLLQLPNELEDAIANFQVTIGGTLSAPDVGMDIQVHNKGKERDVSVNDAEGLSHMIDLVAHFSENMFSLRADIGVDAGAIYDANASDNIRDDEGVSDNGRGSVSRGHRGDVIDSYIDIKVPLDLSLYPFSFGLNVHNKLEGSAKLECNISALSSLIFDKGHVVDGVVNGAFIIAGTVSSPLVTGGLALKNGAYSYPPAGVDLKQILVNISAQNNRLNINEFKAEDNLGNKLNGNGFISINSLNDMNYSLAIKAEDMRLIEHPSVSGVISGDIVLTGTEKSGNLEGKIFSDEVNIYLPDRFAENVDMLNIVKTLPFAGELGETKREEDKREDGYVSYPLLLDMAVEADNKIFIRGRGVDAELKGNLLISGDISDPKIVGKLSTIRGRYEEFGKLFKLEKVEIEFSGASPPEPYLHLIAMNSIDDVEIRPMLSGPINNLVLNIESKPSMPQEEALSLLLFGKGSVDISPFQAVTLANSLRKLSGYGGGGFDPSAVVRKTLGVDDITVRGDGETTSVGVGKYISDQVYIEVERGAETSSSKARIEVEITPYLSVESSTGAVGESSVGVHWKHDY